MKIQKRKRNLQWLIALAALALVVLCVSLLFDVIGRQGGGFFAERPQEEQEEEPLELELVYAYQNAQWNSAIETVAREFEKEHPEIHIRYEVNIGDRVYEEILKKKIARDEFGDIVQLKTPDAYAKSGLLGSVRSDVSDMVTSVYRYDGKVYGTGAVGATSGIIYNRALFEKYGLREPRTYGEFLDICRALRAHGVTPLGVGGGDLWHLEYWVNHFFRTDVLERDLDWLRHCTEGKVSWTDAEPAAMLAHLRELFASGYVNEDWQTAPDGSLPYRMSQGEVAMIYTGPWTEAAVRGLSPDLDLGWFYVPDEEGQVCAGENLDTFWSVTKSCAEDPQKYDAAMTFLRYFYERDHYTQVCRGTDTFPLTAEPVSYEMTEIQRDIHDSFYAADRRIATYIGNEDTPEDFEKVMLNLVKDVASGEMPQSEGLEKMQENWERLRTREAEE